jgi:hypothetical protein
VAITRRPFHGGQRCSGYQGTAAAAFHHMPRGGAQREEGTIQIDAHHALPFGGFQRGEAGRMAIGAGIGKTRIHTAKFFDGFRKGAFHRRLIANIADSRVQSHAKRLQAFQGGRVFRGTAAPYRDIRTGFCQRPRHAKPNAGIAAGDQRHLAAEIKRRIGHGVQ